MDNKNIGEEYICTGRGYDEYRKAKYIPISVKEKRSPPECSEGG
jgi:hypothetical protein